MRTRRPDLFGLYPAWEDRGLPFWYTVLQTIEEEVVA